MDKGLSQEKLAEIMRVDVTTIYRWEAGIVAPSLSNMLHLRDILSKFDGLRHPLMKFLLEQPEATALLDREGIYRDANRPFLNHVRLDTDRLIGHYSPNCLEFWYRYIYAETRKRPEDLVVSDVAEVTVVTDGSETQLGRPARHRINIVRQEQFSVVMVHRIELPEGVASEGVKFTRRFEPPQ